MVEVPVSMRVVQRAMFLEALDVVGTLHLVEHRVAAPVGASDGVAVLVEIETPGVATPFTKQLELLRERVIAPDALLELNSTNLGRNRAALIAIEPTVWSPLERVGNGMSV